MKHVNEHGTVIGVRDMIKLLYHEMINSIS